MQEHFVYILDAYKGHLRAFATPAEAARAFREDQNEPDAYLGDFDEELQHTLIHVPGWFGAIAQIHRLLIEENVE